MIVGVLLSITFKAMPQEGHLLSVLFWSGAPQDGHTLSVDIFHLLTFDERKLGLGDIFAPDG
jgi:hypothetical protein